jgi:hypothetical protein
VHWALVHSSSLAHASPEPFFGRHVEAFVSQYASPAQSLAIAQLVLHVVAPHA